MLKKKLSTLKSWLKNITKLITRIIKKKRILNSSRTEKALYLVKAFSLKTLQVLILGFGVWVILNLCVLAGSTCMLYPKSEVIVKAGEQPFITSMCAIGVVVQLWFYIVHAYPENDPRYDEPPEFMWWYWFILIEWTIFFWAWALTQLVYWANSFGVSYSIITGALLFLVLLGVLHLLKVNIKKVAHQVKNFFKKILVWVAMRVLFWLGLGLMAYICFLLLQVFTYAPVWEPTLKKNEFFITVVLLYMGTIFHNFFFANYICKDPKDPRYLKNRKFWYFALLLKLSITITVITAAVLDVICR